MSRSGLAFRFTLLTSLLILTTSLTLSLFVLWNYRHRESSEISQRGITLARNLAHNSELGVLTRNRELLRELVSGLFQEPDVTEVSVRDASGAVILAQAREGTTPQPMVVLSDPSRVSAGAGIARISHLARSAGDGPMALEIAYPVFTRRGQRANEEIGFLLEEEEDSNARLETVGEARVTVSLDEAHRQMRSLQWAFGTLTAIVIAVGVLLTVLLTRLVVQPIRSLVQATNRIAEGNLEDLVEVVARDEVGELARSFNQMTAHLQRSRKELESYSAELERQVKARTRELQEAQSQLVQAEKMSAVGLLVSGVAHELNNPLAGVVGYSQLLLREETSERIRRGLEKINKEAERCKKIVQNLQTFARKHKPQKDYVSINDVLESALELRAYQLRVDNITVELDLDPSLPKTMADVHQLQQVFVNIFVNAHQAMAANGEGGLLLIRSNGMDGCVRVEIRDSGPGIPEEVRSRIFDPFFTTKEVGQGTGLGLSICYGIVEEHHGRIAARNGETGGAIFTVDLPIIRPPAQAATEAREAPETQGSFDGKGRNILVVDDELTIVDILYQVLKSDGYRVDTALSGSTALRKLEKERYDVIISDLKMPGMSGQDLYERVRSLDSSLAQRIIFSTGDVVNTDTRRFLESCGNAYLQKPFEIDAIRQAVVAVMQGAVLESGPL